MPSKFRQILQKSDDFYALAKRGKSHDRLRKLAEALHTVVPDDAVTGEPSRGVIYIDSDFDAEFEEAKRYPEFQSKSDWLQAAAKGLVVPWSELGEVSNHSDDVDSLDPEKKERVETAILRDKVEYPIVGKWPNGQLEMIAGNTRVAMLKHLGHDPMVWLIDVPAKRASQSFFFKKLAQSIERSQEQAARVALAPLSRNIKSILVPEANDKDLEEWQEVNESFIEPIYHTSSVLYKSGDFFLVSNYLDGDSDNIYAVSKSKRNKSQILDFIKGPEFARIFPSEDNGQAELDSYSFSSESFIPSLNSVPPIVLYKFKRSSRSLPKVKTESFVEEGNKWIEYLLNESVFFIDDDSPLKRYSASDVNDFISKNKSAIQKIKSHFGVARPAPYESGKIKIKGPGPSKKVKEPIEIGSGADGIAFDIGDQKVLKIFKSRYAFDALKKQEDLMHLEPEFGNTEMMLYDFGELEYNGKIAYYSVMPKVETFPSLDLGKVKFEDIEEVPQKSAFMKYFLEGKNVSRKELKLLLHRQKDIELAFFAAKRNKLNVGNLTYGPEDLLLMNPEDLIATVDRWKYEKNMFSVGINVNHIKARIIELINENIDEINVIKEEFNRHEIGSQNRKDISKKRDLWARSIAEKISVNPRLKDRINALESTGKFVGKWIEDFAREILTKYMTGRIDLHMGNLGIDNGRLRHFDAAYNGDAYMLEHLDRTLEK